MGGIRDNHWDSTAVESRQWLRLRLRLRLRKPNPPTMRKKVDTKQIFVELSSAHRV